MIVTISCNNIVIGYESYIVLWYVQYIESGFLQLDNIISTSINKTF